MESDLFFYCFFYSNETEQQEMIVVS
jgi:hypothetical protein